MPVHTDQIESFLSTVEGPSQRRGYVPCRRIADGKGRNYTGPDGTAACGCQFASTGRPGAFRAMGASGVTIATGCDLGQTDAATLAAYGLDKFVVSLFAPYFGKRRDAALAALHSRPLLVEAEQAAATDRAVHAGYLNRNVIPAYEKASGLKFADQPAEAQAVIMSVCFQKGCAGVARDWPKLWSRLISRDWSGAARELATGFTQYAERRRKEGRLLERLA